MKRTIRKKIAALFMSIVVLISFSSVAFADSYDKFSVEPVLPENQINKNLGYYDLLVEPNMKQTIELDVINSGQETMIAKVALEDGSTGNNATKQFSRKVEPDISMKMPITSVAAVRNSEVSVPAGGREKVYIDINMPEETFDGVLLGGITVIADDLNEGKAPKDAGGSLTIDNRLAYVLGLQLSMNDKLVEKNLNYLNTSVKVVDLQPQFISTIQNDQAIVLNDVKVSGTIKNTKNRKVVAEVNRVDGGILPNSQFDVVYSLIDDSMKPGTYSMELEISDPEKTWNWSDTFEVSSEESKEVNEGKVDFNTFTFSWVYAIIGALILLVLFLLFILWKRKKEEDENDEHSK